MKGKVVIKILIILVAMFFSIISLGEINKSNAAEITGTWDISADDGQSNVTATLYDDGNFIISGRGAMKEYTHVLSSNREYNEKISEIKHAIVEQGIINIGSKIFYECSNLTSIEIPESVTSIGDETFYECSSLTSIKIPNSVTSIGRYAFRECSSLTSIEIPESVTIIRGGAFRECSSLTSIEIPDRVTVIEDYTFYLCSSLTSINMPNGITSIGSSAFSGCSSLTSIEIPEEVTSIGEYPFNNCESLMEVKVDENNQYFCSEDGILYDKNKNKLIFCLQRRSGEIIIPEGVTIVGCSAFSGCSSLTSIEIPEGVTSIEKNAFSGCSSLTSIEIPEGVTSIEDYAFEGCSSLTNIKIPEGVTCIEWSLFKGCSSLTNIEVPKSVTSIEGYAFQGCSSLTSIEIPEEVTYIGYSNTFKGCSSLTSINIPNGVTSIGEETFRECSSLTSINIPNGVTSIGSSAFEGCSSLTIINIPEGVTSIEWHVFQGCSSLTSIEIPEGVTSIKGYAFQRCSSLTSINIPNGVTSIGEGTFEKCSSLTSINIPNGINNIGENTFKECRSLTSIEIPEGVTNIGRNAFCLCSSLASIEIPDRVTVIEDNTFYFCSSLTSINIPNGVTSIGSSAFEGCSSLTSINIPEGVTSIGECAFIYCESLMEVKVDENNQYFCSEDGILYDKNKNKLIFCLQRKSGKIIIPEGVTTIGKCAFLGCSSITSINIPEGVTSIEREAFSGCKSLTSIEIPEGVTSIEVYTFHDCSSLTSIKIPEGVTSIGWRAFYLCGSLTSINIPNGVTSISNEAFSICNSLTSINIPEGLTSIEDDTFYGCSSLTSIEIPEGVTKIGSNAFYSCDSLTSIEIPNSVTSIGNNSFKYCKSLTIYTPSDYVADYAQNNNINYVLDKIVPEINVVGNLNVWTKENIIVRVTDGQTAIKRLIVNRNEEPVVNGVGEYTITENGVYNFEARDKAGNITTQSIEVTKIDKEQPTLTIGEYTQGWTKDDIVLNITASDNLSGLAHVKVNGNTVNINEERGIYNISQNGRYEIVATDNAGNTETKTIQIYNIDKASPKINSIDGNASDWTKEDVTLSIETTDGDGSGIESITVTDSKGNVTEIDKNNKKYIANKNDTYTIKVRDNAGNENTKTVTVDKIDKEGPEIEITEEKNEEGIKIKITAIDNGIGLDKVTINGEEIEITNNEGEYNITSEGKYEVIGTDKIGNITKKTYNYSLIDIIVEGNPTNWTKSDVLLTITAKGEGENIDNVTVNGQKITMVNGVGNYTVRQNGKYEIIATNSQGEERTTTVEVIKIDKEEPIINKVEGNPTEWTKEDVTIKVNAVENLSGLANEAYSFDGGKTWQASNEKTYTENAENIVIKVKDQAGNIREYSPISITKIDKEKPTINNIEGNPTEWTKEDVTLKVNAVDNVSGLANEAYSFDGGNTWQASNEKTYTENVKNIVIKVKDQAGNITEYSPISITKIDKKTPVINSVEGNPTEWTKEDVTLKVNAVDNLSGLANEAYSFDGGKTWQASNEKTFTENKLYMVIRVKDQAGNKKQYSIISITKIDKEGPEIEITEEKNEEGVKIKITAIDNGIGLDKVTINGEEIEITNNEGEYNITSEGKYEVIGTDKIGNITKKTYNYSLIDLVVEGNPTNWTKENVTLTITAKNGEEKIDNVTVNGQKITMLNGVGSYTVNQNGTYEITATDSQGEERTTTVEVTKIDKEVPTLEVTGNASNWTKEDVTLSIETTDGNGSGLGSITVTDSKGNVTEIDKNNKKYIANKNDIYTIKVRDKVGNENTKTVRIDKIDKEGPIINSIEGNPTEWTKEDVTLKVKAEDNVSGLAKEAYSFDGGNTWQASNEKTYKENTENIIIKVKDNLGNVSEYGPISITKILKLTDIRIKQEPNKKTYHEGESFETTGMKVEAVYNNQITEEINNYEIINGKDLNLGQTSVIIRYTEKEITKIIEQFITVSEQEKANIKFNKYKIEEENGTKYVEKIMPGTSIETLKRDIETNGTIEIYKGNTKITNDSQLVGTGMEIRIIFANEEISYKVIVNGDLTGDGKIGIGDLLRLSRYAAGMENKIEREYIRASDIVKDGKYGTISDILKMSRVLAGNDEL